MTGKTTFASCVNETDGSPMSMTRRKVTGAHFTPPDLAALVCERLMPLVRNLPGPLRVLDPACGDGNLLQAIAATLPEGNSQQVTLIGIENDPDSFRSLVARQGDLGNCRVELIQADFLECIGSVPFVSRKRNQASIADRSTNHCPAPLEFDVPVAGEGTTGHGAMAPVDVIIANPPYVRTQVLGSERARALASRFGLSGRIDLYQVFLTAMAQQLRPGGLLGVITSNRFLTTQGGMNTRHLLRTSFDLLEVIDLGDTKLFAAAVLPALVFARKRREGGITDCPITPKFVRIYEAANGDEVIGTAGVGQSASSILDCLRGPQAGRYTVNGTPYRVTTGRLLTPSDDARPWAMLTDDELAWLERIHQASTIRIADVANVRVGIKTTADSVFIRNDWQSLPAEIRPETKHLRPILSRENATRWLPRQRRTTPDSRVLYTHEVVDGRRRALRFDHLSPTWRYLLEHRERLESRKYVIAAGRAWYEVWVPQDPLAWQLPKIVFPDISPDARFFLDRQGHVVDGNCYWITTNEPDNEDLLLLILGVANSTVMTRYHDLAFQNRLYAQRRRHLTQYIAEYPLPDPRCSISQQISTAVRRLVDHPLSPDMQLALESEVDRLVATAFGLDPSTVLAHSD